MWAYTNYVLVVTYFLLSGYYMLFIYDEAFHPPTIIRYHCYIFSAWLFGNVLVCNRKGETRILLKIM